MILSDIKIVEELLSHNLIVTPLLNGKKQIGSSSIDIRLGTEFRYIKTSKQTHFDLNLPIERIKEQVEEYTEVVHIKPMDSFILHPNDFVLASTLEYFIIPKNLTARLEGRSTWGRVGLQVHSTAGFVDPGFEGSLTFELHNMGKLPLPLYPGIRIGQLSFHQIEEAQILYSENEDSKYGKITGTKSSMFFEEYEFNSIINYNKMKKAELTDQQIDSILSEKFDVNFWYFQLGVASESNEIFADNEFSINFYKRGIEQWEIFIQKISELICDIDNKKPKDWVEEAINGDIRNFIIALATLFVSNFSIELSLAIPLVALALKQDIKKFCKEI